MRLQETESILRTVLSIQPRTTDGGGGRSNDDIVAEIAVCATLKRVVWYFEEGDVVL